MKQPSYTLNDNNELLEQTPYRSFQEAARAEGVVLKYIFNRMRPKGGLTVAYRLDKPERKNSLMVEIATAYCSEHDTFNKSYGAQLALDNFFSGRTMFLPLASPTRDFIDDNLDQMFDWLYF